MHLLARAWLVFMLPFILSCSPEQSQSSAKAPPQPSPQSATEPSAQSAAEPPPEPSWAGTWSLVTGSAIPREKRIVLQQTCNSSPEHWTIRQDHAQITLEKHKARNGPHGPTVNTVRVDFERAQGQRRGFAAHLDGKAGTEVIGHPEIKDRPAQSTMTFELEYDPKTEHLVGTRNGAPVRFIRAEIVSANSSRSSSPTSVARPCEPDP